MQCRRLSSSTSSSFAQQRMQHHSTVTLSARVWPKLTRNCELRWSDCLEELRWSDCLEVLGRVLRSITSVELLG